MSDRWSANREPNPKGLPLWITEANGEDAWRAGMAWPRSPHMVCTASPPLPQSACLPLPLPLRASLNLSLGRMQFGSELLEFSASCAVQ